MKRNFYALNMPKVIDEVYEICHTCAALRRFLRNLWCNEVPEAVGVSFVADVLKWCKPPSLSFVKRQHLSQRHPLSELGFSNIEIWHIVRKSKLHLFLNVWAQITYKHIFNPYPNTILSYLPTAVSRDKVFVIVEMAFVRENLRGWSGPNGFC